MESYSNSEDRWGALRRKVQNPTTSASKQNRIDQTFAETANENNRKSFQPGVLEKLAEAGQKAAKLRLAFANGNRYSFYYSFMTCVEYCHADGLLKIITTDKEILISGKGMDILEEQVYDNIRKTIHESKVALIDPEALIVVKEIKIQDRHAEE